MGKGGGREGKGRVRGKGGSEGEEGLFNELSSGPYISAT